METTVLCSKRERNHKGWEQHAIQQTSTTSGEMGDDQSYCVTVKGEGERDGDGGHGGVAHGARARARKKKTGP